MSGRPLVRRPAPGGRGQGGVPIQRENRRSRRSRSRTTSACTASLAGMTGTADTEGVRVPADLSPRDGRHPHAHAEVRKDATTSCSARSRKKVDAIIGDIKDCYAAAQPVLVGTTSIENSECCRSTCRRKSCRTKCSTPSSTRARRDRSAGGQVQGHHDRDQHGRPRHRHRAGRHAGAADPQMRDDESLLPAEKEREIARLRAEWQVRHDGRGQGGRPAHRPAPSATSRAASTTSSRRGAGARATPASVALLPVARGFRCCASSAASGSARSCRSSRCPKASRSSIRS